MCKGVEKTRLERLVVLRDPFRGVIQVNVELVHHDGEDVPVLVA